MGLAAYTSVPFIDGYCNHIGSGASSYSYRWVCGGDGTARQETFFSSDDCSGNATVTSYDISYAVACSNATNVGASGSIGLTCGTASFTGDVTRAGALLSVAVSALLYCFVH